MAQRSISAFFSPTADKEEKKEKEVERTEETKKRTVSQQKSSTGTSKKAPKRRRLVQGAEDFDGDKGNSLDGLLDEQDEPKNGEEEKEKEAEREESITTECSVGSRRKEAHMPEQDDVEMADSSAAVKTPKPGVSGESHASSDLGSDSGSDSDSDTDADSPGGYDDDGGVDETGASSAVELIPPAALQAKHVASKFTTKRFDPVKDAIWKAGEPVPYLAVARAFATMENTTKRLEITEELTQLFRSVLCLSPDDMLAVVYLCTNSLGPTWEGLKLEIGESILQKAIAEATGRTLARIKEEYKEIGDLGLLAEQSRGTQRTMFTPAPLTVGGVLKKFVQIAQLSGNATQQKKRDLIKSILVACREQEARYSIRSLQGNLRIGLAEKTVLCALAHACVLSPPEPLGGGAERKRPARDVNAASRMRTSKLETDLIAANETIRAVFAECPNFELVVQNLLMYPISELHDHLKLSVGSPVHPMLAQPTRGIGEVCERLHGKEFTCEYKYDGERAQIHMLEDGTVRIYSRNLEDHTTKYPDIVASIPNAVVESPNVRDDAPADATDIGVFTPATSFILDCEAVAYDCVEKRILPFQVLSTRGKKNVNVEDVKVRVCLFAFDLLYLNGQSLLREPLRKRRAHLRRCFREVDAEFKFAVGMDSNDPEVLQELLEKAVGESTEGLMVKTLDHDATYEPSRRSYSWLKVKKDYLEGMGDTLDLVVIGAYSGRGKRTGVYGGYLLACYDDDNEQYQSICRIGTGFSDEDLKRFTALFKELIIPKAPSYYSYDHESKNDLPDVWVEPKIVMEVLCADISISPKHKAAQGLVDPNKGIALRFPRFIRERTDKTPEQATSAEQVADMYRAQAVISSGSGGARGPPAR